jgi:hypothetical protein
MRVRTFSWPMPRRGSLFTVDELRDGALAVADDVAGHALGDGDELAADDEHAVVEAGDVGLDDDELECSWAFSNATRTASEVSRLIETPRPWLASSGLTTTG